jgi:hypothetical protein
LSRNLVTGDELTTPAPAIGPTRSRLRRVRAVLLVYVVLFFLIVFTGCADRLILFPSRQPIPLPGISRVELAATAQTKALEVWTARSHALAEGAEPEAYCLEFTGNASRGEEMAYAGAGEWGDHPVEIWAVNYPGYGGSAGAASL